MWAFLFCFLTEKDVPASHRIARAITEPKQMAITSVHGTVLPPTNQDRRRSSILFNKASLSVWAVLPPYCQPGCLNRGHNGSQHGGGQHVGPTGAITGP